MEESIHDLRGDVRRALISFGSSLNPGLRRTKADMMVGRGFLIFSKSRPMRNATTSVASVIAANTAGSGEECRRAPHERHDFSMRRPAGVLSNA